MSRKLWSKEELVLVFNLYLKMPFGKMHARNPDIINMANILGRTPNSIALRLVNFAACDPFHQNRGIKGMAGGKKQCQPIWDEYIHNQEELIFLSEEILAKEQSMTLEMKFDLLLSDTQHLKGETKIREVKTRVNQHVFREIVLANYQNKCAITNIDIPELLLASHIMPWAKNEKERLNPENGICFSALYDKAYDKGLIAINENYKILLSDKIKQKTNTTYFQQHFKAIENQKINLPQKYLPKKEFIQYHLDEIFNKKAS